MGSVPGQGAKIPHALQPKNQNIKQKQQCNKFNKDKKKKRERERRNRPKKKGGGDRLAVVQGCSAVCPAFSHVDGAQGSPAAVGGVRVAPGPVARVPSRSISYSAPSSAKLSRGPQLPFDPSVISDAPRGVLVAREPHSWNLPMPSQGRLGQQAEKQSGMWGKDLGVRTVVEEVISGGRTREPPLTSQLSEYRPPQYDCQEETGYPAMFAFQLNNKHLFVSSLFQRVLFAKSKMKVKVAQSCPNLCDPSPWNSPGQNTGEGSLSLLQGIFPTQVLNPGLPHCRWILYHPSHKGSPGKSKPLPNTSQALNPEGSRASASHTS